MNYKPIIIVAGEPKSIFFEIFFKSLKIKKFKSPLVLICSEQMLKMHMKIFRFKKNINKIDWKNLNIKKLNNRSINLIDVKYNQKDIINLNNQMYQDYLYNSFQIAFNLIRKGVSNKLINGPISKKKFLKKKYLGITEYISEQFNIKKSAMLIYNNKLSVCPVTTHLPIKLVSKNIIKNKIKEKIILINDFYKKKLKIKPKIAILGLNPHCESISKFNEDEKIVKPLVNVLKKKNYKISGPFSADTIFLKSNRDKFNVIIGMYHDQVLSPFKALFEYDAINITLGLPFLRISPDHGPNETMVGLNRSNPLSLVKAISFLDKN